MSYKIYRCQTDGKLVFEKDFSEHPGHRVSIASNGTVFEFIKIKLLKFIGMLEERQFWQN